MMHILAFSNYLFENFIDSKGIILDKSDIYDKMIDENGV
jgi:hypothetical protein